MNHLKFELLGFLSAIGLMSRIPLQPFIGQTQLLSEHHNRSQIWYPGVGVVLGALLFVWFWLAPSDWSDFLNATILVVIWVAFTGALHLDGLADSVDAWVGGMGSQDKTLAIMKDPASGPMAVVALVLVLLIKVALIAEILASLQGKAFILLALIPMLVRAWLLPFLYKTPYARQKKFDAHLSHSKFDNQTIQTSELNAQQGGMATDIASEFPKRAAFISFAMSQLIVLLALLFLGWNLFIWVALSLAAVLVFFLIRNACINRIGGYTGDVLGAYIELQELTLLFTLAVSMTLL